MSALFNLQNEYNCSSESDCSDDDDDHCKFQNNVNNVQNSAIIKEKKLPLPSIFTDISSVCVGVDKIHHQGRTRSFAHERGNWATHLYLPYPEQLQNELQEYCNDAVIQLKNEKSGM